MNLGVDVGGTFTDSVAIDADGRIFIGKSPTTPERIANGVMASLADLAEKAGRDLSEMLQATDFFGHGTTVGTNTLVTRSGASIGLLITAGFEDTPYIQRAIGRLAGLTDEEMRDQVNLRQPVPLVERNRIRGVVERVASNGEVVIPLSEAEAEAAVRGLLDEGVEAIAICLLWSFLNPAHERMLQAAAQKLAPAVPLSLSCELASKIRENARTNTVLIDAFVRGKVDGYLADLHQELTTAGFRNRIATIQCFGGVSDSEDASAISTIGSGPVGGVMASKYLASLMGERNVITTDVGGTTFDVSVIWRGEELIAREFFGSAGVMSRFEVLTPRVDIDSIGAGGGTIAWFDRASETIKLGPESAGSVPGPVFYGRGGGRATVADAWLTLGYLDPGQFLGGRIATDSEAARAAIEEQLARPAGVTVERAALAIVELANNHMSDAIRVYMAARGLDPREFVMFAFGGGGPMHAAAYGRLSGVRRTYLIANSGVFSAFGIALADSKQKLETTLLAREPFDLPAVAEALDDLERQLKLQFTRRGLAPETLRPRHFLDIRYRGQVHELSIEVPGADWVAKAEMADIRARFDDHYRAQYGAGAASAYSQIELVGIGVDGIAETPKPSLSRRAGARTTPKAVAHREALFAANEGYRRTPVYAYADLAPGHKLAGPAIVQDSYLTMLILPAQTAVVDEFGNLAIDH